MTDELETVAGSDGTALDSPDATRLLVAALARGESYAAAASAAGVSVRTVERRMADPGFRALVSEALRGAVADGARMLVADTPDAVRTIRELRGEEASSKAGASTRLKAAIATIELADRLTTTQALLAHVMGRLGRLERTREPVS